MQNEETNICLRVLRFVLTVNTGWWQTVVLKSMMECGSSSLDRGSTHQPRLQWEHSNHSTDKRIMLNLKPIMIAVCWADMDRREVRTNKPDYEKRALIMGDRGGVYLMCGCQTFLHSSGLQTATKAHRWEGFPKAVQLTGAVYTNHTCILGNDIGLHALYNNPTILLNPLVLVYSFLTSHISQPMTTRRYSRKGKYGWGS